MPFKQRQADKWRLTEAQRAWTCDRLTLIDHASLSLDQRCQAVRVRFGQTIHKTTLRNYYKRAGVSYRQPLRNLATSMSPELLRENRIRFIGHLLQRLRAGRTIWYFDETTTNLWERISRVWQPRQPIRMQLPKMMGSNTTILGALSSD